MHFLHLLPTFDTGGLGSLGLDLIAAWPKQEYFGDRHVVIASRFPNTKPNLRFAFERLCGDKWLVEDVFRNMMQPMQFVSDLAATIGARGPNAGALIYNFLDFVWYGMALRRTGYSHPIICHVGTVLPPVERVRRMFDSPVTEHVRFVPASGAVRAGLVAAGCPEANILPVRWNGVDLDTFYPAQRLAALPTPAAGVFDSFPSDPIVVGFTGRMAPEAKDYPSLLRAWSVIPPPVRAQARLLLVGDGPLRDSYEAMCQTLGLSVGDATTADPRDVYFLGNMARSAIPDFLRTLDLFVMAALPIEGMSLALVEAIASGLPIVATNVPANREVLQNRAGHLVEPDALGRALEWLITDEQARVKLRALSVAYRTEFDVKVVAAAYRGFLLDW